jgi:hypothetical protein
MGVARILNSERIVTCMWNRSSGMCTSKKEAVPRFVDDWIDG